MMLLIGSFSECMCNYFDDSALNEGYLPIIKEKILTEKKFAIVSSFHVLVDQYHSKDKTDTEIIFDNNWKDLTNEADKAWYKLKEVITDTNEIAYMAELEKNPG
jgi:hypothetical protein